jgi:hypothetical protein
MSGPVKSQIGLRRERRRAIQKRHFRGGMEKWESGNFWAAALSTSNACMPELPSSAERKVEAGQTKSRR